jgi:hypothetical protein
MTKVNIKKLDSLTHNDTAATKLINDNFQAIEKALEDSLSRVSNVPNYMDTELDMNTRRIINTATPIEDGDVINKKYLEEHIGNSKEYAEAAQAAADSARSSAKAAQVYNQESQTYAEIAAQHAKNRARYKETMVEVPVNSWRNSSQVFEWPDVYPYACDVVVKKGLSSILEGIEFIPTVTFFPLQADSGNYSTIAKGSIKFKQGSSEGYDLIVTIFAKEIPEETFYLASVVMD